MTSDSIAVARGTDSSFHIHELDSLRGLAAMTVVFHHCLVIFPLFWAAYEARHLQLPALISAMAFSPLHLAWGGAEAVNVFFVLSGLVLAFPFLGPRPPRAVPFILRRMIRIYLPYIAVMAAATFVMEVFLPFGHPHASVWFDQYWNRRASGLTVLNYGLMLGLGRENFVNPVMWSLIHEFRISLIFPLMAHLVNLRRPVEVLTSTLVFSFGAKLALHFMGMAHWWSTLLDTCQYFFFFMAGAEMARHRAQLSGLFNRASALTRTAVCAGSLLLLNARWELPPALSELRAACCWAGAILIVGFTLASAGQAQILRWPPFLWLGTISYSLYLTHCLVLMAGLFAFQTALPTVLIVACVPAVSLGIAALVYRIIELPAMLLARRMTAATAFERSLPRAAKVWQ